MSPDVGKRDAGFTLIELLIVLAIIGLGLAMVVPAIEKWANSSAQGASLAEIRAVLRGASSQAIAESRTVSFRGGAGGYWLDDGYHRLQGATAATISVFGGGMISFYSWGGSSGGRIRIETAAGAREITIDAASGRPAIRR